MSKARELAELGAVYDSGALSNRNIIINGAMNVSQRGDYSSATSLTDDTYFIDRWVSDLATVSATIQNVSNGYLSKSKTQKLAATSSATGRIVSIQKIEVSSYMLGVELTASAQVKSNSSNARLFLVDNTNGTVLGVQAHTGGGAFEKLVVSGTPPTTCTDLRVYVAFRSAAQANVAITSGDFFEFTEVQLELGTEATPFEHRSFGQELALCERYFQKYNYSSNTSSADTQNTLPLVAAYSGGTGYAGHKLTHTMRTSPTFSASAANTWVFYAGGSSYTPSEMTAYETGPSMWGQKYVATSNFTTGHAVYGRASSTSSYYQFDAEL